MSGENRMNHASVFQGTAIRRVFEDNWNESFLTDGKSGITFSYKDFMGLVLGCKQVLDSKGLREGDRLCIFLPNSVELAALYFTAIAMRLVAVPVDVNRGEMELNDILPQACPDAVVCEKKNAGTLSKYGRIVIPVESMRSWRGTGTSAEKDDLKIFDSIDYGALYLITFTSGSTGVPKGVKHSLGNLLASAAAFRERFGFGRGDAFYHNLPMTYMAGILNLIILPFISESRIILGERFSITAVQSFWNVPSRFGANAFWFVPTEVSLLLKLDRGKDGIEYCTGRRMTACVGTAPLNQKIRGEFEKKYGMKLYESYGLSETLFVSTVDPGISEYDCGVGRLLDGVELGFSADGEIAISVPWMFLGYTNRMAEDYFADGKYLSGDLGEMDGGFLRITGRKKDLIIKGGMNISPRRLEEFILNSTDVFNEVVVLGVPDETLGEKVVCFGITGKTYSTTAVKELNRRISGMLGRDHQVDEFVIVDDIPKNANGKIDKILLMESYGKKGK